VFLALQGLKGKRVNLILKSSLGPGLLMWAIFLRLVKQLSLTQPEPVGVKSLMCKYMSMVYIFVEICEIYFLANLDFEKELLLCAVVFCSICLCDCVIAF